jgi:hypothetical protein
LQPSKLNCRNWAIFISHLTVSLRQQWASSTGPLFFAGVAPQEKFRGKHEHAKFVPLDLRNTQSLQ